MVQNRKENGMKELNDNEADEVNGGVDPDESKRNKIIQDLRDTQGPVKNDGGKNDTVFKKIETVSYSNRMTWPKG